MSIAIIGLGVWGKNLIREFSKIYDIRYCVSNGNIKNIRWLKQNYPTIIHVPDIDFVLNDNSVTIVIIAAPINTHYELTLKALSKGKHVFVEKPLAQNSSQAYKLLNLAKKNNLHLFVGHVFAYHPIFQKVIDIHKKETIQFMKFDWSKPDNSGEDILFDLASHDLFLIYALFGKPKTINLLFSHKIFKNSDIVILDIAFSKIKCVIDINRCALFKSKTVTFQTTKNLYVWDDYVLYKFNKTKNQFQIFYKSTKTSLEMEIKEFLKLCSNPHDYSNPNISVKVIESLESLKR